MAAYSCCICMRVNIEALVKSWSISILSLRICKLEIEFSVNFSRLNVSLVASVMLSLW